ncbi:MAG: tRNA (adenosine(37)-N6)-threonylcarbamoyltransferase complex ATPase subunit type 1 TsaE [Acidobacteriaceae bacterium]
MKSRQVRQSVFITRSPEETIALGTKLAPLLQPPLLVLLRGDLGAGKTTLVKGIAQGFAAAAQDEVTSPTFTLVHEYRGPIVTVYHLDVYRIESERELETIAIDDLRTANALLLIEWGEKFSSLRQAADAEIVIERLSDDQRQVSIGRGHSP